MDMYTFNNGDKHGVPPITIPEDITLMFKLNLPSTEENFNSGNGEGVWACTCDDVASRLDKDETGGVYFAKILNDSTYYPGLSYGSIIAMELRGENRPIAFFTELNEKYGISQREEVIQELIERRHP